MPPYVPTPRLIDQRWRQPAQPAPLQFNLAALAPVALSLARAGKLSQLAAAVETTLTIIDPYFADAGGLAAFVASLGGPAAPATPAPAAAVPAPPQPQQTPSSPSATLAAVHTAAQAAVAAR